MKTGTRLIANGNEFNRFFRTVSGKTEVLKRFAGLDDTVRLMKEVIENTLEDTKQLAEILQRQSVKESCRSIWTFCFKHLQYQKDQTGKEQVRSPARTWRDRIKGVDCDCMTVFIGSLLTNMKIPFSIRLTRYQANDFEHVYPVVESADGTIIMDSVVHQFNYEVPFTQKKDIKMELQYLNGFEDEEFDESENERSLYPEFSELPYGEIDLEGLGRTRRQDKPPLKERAKKGLHVVNRVNPATALLRAGVLASMKLNLMNVASKLRYAYWTEDQAKKNNVELAKFIQLKTILSKIEKVFYGAGGKPENLKEAILKGRGNRDKKVGLNGFGWIDTSTVFESDDLKTILGNEVYFDELYEVQKANAINGLGEAVSATAAMAAASGIIATIAGLLKKIGSIFKKGSPEESEETILDNTAKEEEKQSKFRPTNLLKRLTSDKSSETLPSTISDDEEITTTDLDQFDNTKKSMDTKSDTTPDGSSGVVQWIKDHPLLTAGIAATVIAGTIWAVKSYKASKKKGKKELNGIEGVDGVKIRKQKPAKSSKRRQGKSKPKVHSTGKRKTSIRRIELL